MAEGLSATEVGKEIAEHAEHSQAGGHDRIVSIAEALLLSIVAVVAAWSGFSAAKWGTESSLKLAKASAVRTKANAAYLQSFTLRSQDASNFNAWFTAYLSHDKVGQRIAEKPDQYYSKIYGVQEVGGTSVLYLSAVPFAQIGPSYDEIFRRCRRGRARRSAEPLPRMPRVRPPSNTEPHGHGSTN